MDCRYTEIRYEYNGRRYSCTVCANEVLNWLTTYEERVVDVIESITNSGAVVTSIDRYGRL